MILRGVIQMAENKMTEVAKLFGKELGEEFWIQGFCGIYRVKFTEGGILYLDTDEPNNYRWRLYNIDPLLTGNAEILSSDDWRVKQTIKDLSKNKAVIVDERR